MLDDGGGWIAICYGDFSVYVLLWILVLLGRWEWFAENLFNMCQIQVTGLYLNLWVFFTSVGQIVKRWGSFYRFGKGYRWLGLYHNWRFLTRLM